MKPSPNHPAVRAAKVRRTAPWRCWICEAAGLGGRDGWDHHYITHHYTPGENT